jgi:serine/threonine protein kinase/Tol biopolymer transport system component
MTQPREFRAIEPFRSAVADRYRLNRELGHGGMATVYLAHDLRHDRQVAIKVLHEDLGATLGPERFLAEIKTTAKLQHPHILPLLDSGQVGGLLYYVMPYVEGETLRSRLTRETQLPIEDTVRIALEVADALSFAHSHGIVHRDIKPENILLQGGHALVADFGIALAVQEAGGPRLTQTGLSLGTPQYMSPEQAMGEKSVDARSDIYALGAVTYEMLTGEPPFPGSSAQAVVARVLSAEPQRPTLTRKTIPPNVEATVLKALAKLPADRFESAARFAEALTRPEPSIRSPAIVAGAPGSGSWLRDWRSLVSIGVAVAALASSAWLLWRRVAAGRTPSTVTFSQKTFRREAIFTSRFAPDGKTIVYSAATEGNDPRLYVVRPDYPEPQSFGPPRTHLLAVSSTGELAVLLRTTFVAHRVFYGMLARMHVGGGTPREILNEVRDADWSPDGAQLAVIHEVDGRDRLEYPIGKRLYESSGYLSDVRVSPQGEAIALIDHPSRWDDRGDVVRIGLDGQRRVLATGFWGLEGLAWSPDGQSVLFSGAAQGGFYQVHTADARGHVRQPLPSAGSLTVQDVARTGQWLVTRDELPVRLSFVGRGADSSRDLSWLDQSTMPQLSADGELLAFSDQGAFAGTNYAVMVRKTDGSPAVKLGEGVPTDVSRDNAWVLATVPSIPGRLMLYPVGAGQPRQLDRGDLQSYAWAEFFHDGKRVLACGSNARGESRCHVQPIEGGPPTAVTPDGTIDGRVSPDGRFVVVQMLGASARIVPVDGGAARELPAVNNTDHLVRWSPDGRSIWVQGASNLGTHIDRVDVATGRRIPLVVIEPATRSGLLEIDLPTVADDPRVYAYVLLIHESRTFVVDGAR